jgi:VanZ family protein
VVLYAGLIFYLSSLSNISLPLGFDLMDEVLHLFEYLIFGLLLARAIKKTFLNFNKLNICIIVTLIAFLYGISDEFHQSFVPGREVSGWDIFMDGLGGFLGGLFYR